MSKNTSTFWSYYSTLQFLEVYAVLHKKKSSPIPNLNIDSVDEDDELIDNELFMDLGLLNAIQAIEIKIWSAKTAFESLDPAKLTYWPKIIGKCWELHKSW